jgi:hypothetical protein
MDRYISDMDAIAFADISVVFFSRVVYSLRA